MEFRWVRLDNADFDDWRPAEVVSGCYYIPGHSGPVEPVEIGSELHNDQTT